MITNPERIIQTNLNNKEEEEEKEEAEEAEEEAEEEGGGGGDVCVCIIAYRLSTSIKAVMMMMNGCSVRHTH